METISNSQTAGLATLTLTITILPDKSATLASVLASVAKYAAQGVVGFQRGGMDADGTKFAGAMLYAEPFTAERLVDLVRRPVESGPSGFVPFIELRVLKPAATA